MLVDSCNTTGWGGMAFRKEGMRVNNANPLYCDM